jgi:hypothetical protein
VEGVAVKVLVGGSRRLPAGSAPRLLINFLAALPADAIILLRKGAFTEPNRFEADVESLCSFLHLDWEWVIPKPTAETPGRAAVFFRDYDAVERADLTIVFVTPEDIASSSGTMHVLEAALALARPIYAYSVKPDGTVERVGELDPDNIFADRVPVP